MPHIIRVSGRPGETWKITGIDGVEFRGALPATEVVVPDDQRRAGNIDLEVTGVNDVHPWNWLRHVVEVTEDNAHLLASAL
jgi:hypothetical protein